MTDSRIFTVKAFVHVTFGLVLIGLVGCGSKPAENAELPPPWVTVAPPVERVVTRYEYATGRTAPLEQVEIRARVNGYLLAIKFEQGKEVKKGQVLFEIDPEPYKADLARAKANLETYVAELATAEADQQKTASRVVTTKAEYDRQEEGFKKGVVAENIRDIAKGSYDESSAADRAALAKIKLSKAKIDEGKANVRNAELNLGYCTITAPITGIVGDRLVTEGNLITGGVGNTTLLTTIVAVEKMDVAFDVDENTLQRIEMSVREGKIKMPAPGEIPVEMGLAIHGNDYPIKGYINFADNHVDSTTGTIRMKARFDNPKPTTGPRLLAAGMYARVRVPIGEPVKSMLVPESAFGSDQGMRYLFLVSPDNKAVRWNAIVSTLEGNLRVVESIEIPGKEKPRSLSLSDQVITTGIQRIRPGMIVDPKPASK